MAFCTRQLANLFDPGVQLEGFTPILPLQEQLHFIIQMVRGMEEL